MNRRALLAGLFAGVSSEALAATRAGLIKLGVRPVAPHAPRLISAPSIAGIVRVGELLTVTDGTWRNAPTSYTRRWLRDGVAIAGATGATYLLVTADQGHLITAEVTASNAAGTGEAGEAAAVGPILAAAATTLPSNQTIAFGAKTLTGHGAHLLAYTGSGTLTITSQKDAANADVTLFRITQNGLNWRGASTTYGSAAPTSLNGPYTVVVTDGTRSSTVTVNITANAAHVREMAGVAQGGRWSTDSVYTVDGTGSSGTHQLRTLLAAAGGLAKGDTVWCRDGTLDPTSSGLSVRPAASYSGTGTITIRSETVDTTSDAWGGIKNRQHGFKIRGLKFDGATSGDVYFPISLADLWFQPDAPASTYCLGYSTAKGWGVNVTNCRIEAGPNVLQPWKVTGLVYRGSQADVVSITYNTVTNVSKALVGSNSVVGGRSKGAVISWNDVYSVYEDMITDNGEAAVIEHNFGRDWVYALGKHSDAIQHLHDGTVAGTTYDGPIVRYNIAATNADSIDASQGVFSDDSAAARTLTNTVFSSNIIIALRVNAIYMARMQGPTARFNTCLSIVSVPSIGLYSTPQTLSVVVPSGKSGTDGTFTHNLANGVSVAPQAGTVTSSPNKTVTGLAAYLAALPAYRETNLKTRAAVMAAVRPADIQVANGGAVNPDRTVNGAIGLDGDWNTGLAYAA